MKGTIMKLIVSGHGNFATGLASAAKLITGETFEAVDFVEGMTGEQLNQQLEALLKDLDDSGAIIFTDLLGGAPFRQAALLAHQYANVWVLTGTNLLMLIESALSLDDIQKGQEKAFCDELLNNAREGITAFHLQKPKAQVIEEDGI